MRVLAIGCHPDDIEIACSGTLAKCAKRGDEVYVCHLSSGDLGHVIIPPEELKIIRANEAKKAASLAGIKEVIWGGFNDLDIYSDNKEARDKVVEVIRRVNPDFIYSKKKTPIFYKWRDEFFKNFKNLLIFNVFFVYQTKFDILYVWKKESEKHIRLGYILQLSKKY